MIEPKKYPPAKMNLPKKQEQPSPLQNIYNAALQYHGTGQLANAERCCRTIIAINPLHADSLHLLGTIAFQAGNYLAAVELINKAIGLNDKCSDYYCNLGSALQALGHMDEAVNSYNQALALKPDHAVACNNIGNALQTLGRLEESITAYKSALVVRPYDADTYSNLGSTLQALGRIDEATASYNQALTLKPDHVVAHFNLGGLLQALGKLDDALRHYEQALALRPEYAQAHTKKAMIQLIQGNLTSGWIEYEWRWRIQDFSFYNRKFSSPMWHGEPLNGQRILLHSEQGLGDCLQFLRYLPMVQAAGGIVVLEIPARLQRLAAQLPGVTHFAVTGEPLPPFDQHCPLMSLPLVFGTNLETIPSKVPYLSIPPDALQKASALQWPTEGLRVGLAWAGSSQHAMNQFRSISLSILQPLFDIKEVKFFSLQIDTAAKQLRTINATITDLSSVTTDMADTAAQIAQLDLVISVDTSVAHLAGALAKPFWLLLSCDTDWRWLLEREDSPWYPTARLFRQTILGDWSSVVDRVASSLALLANKAKSVAL